MSAKHRRAGRRVRIQIQRKALRIILRWEFAIVAIDYPSPYPAPYDSPVRLRCDDPITISSPPSSDHVNGDLRWQWQLISRIKIPRVDVS